MDKKYWHHIWTTRIRPIKVWYLLALTLISGFICITALRNNNQTMGRLREEVYSADKNNNEVAKKLQELQLYVTSHMNTSLTAGNSSVYPPIQLKYTYQRLQDAEKQKAASSNSQLYSEAQSYCEQQNSTDFSGRNRVPCIEKYVTDHGGAQPASIPDGMYKFNFTSPSWSPDLAGWSLVFSILLAILLVLRLALGVVFTRFIK